jgi:hypothetical protein
LLQRIAAQNSKIETLYELLEHSEEERKQFQEIVAAFENGDERYRLLEGQFEAKLVEKER